MRGFAFLAFCLALPATLRAQGDSTFTLTPRFGGVQALRLVTPAILRSPWDAGPTLGTPGSAFAWDSTLKVVRDSLWVAETRSWRLRHLYGAVVPGEVDTTANAKGLLGLNRKYADVTIDGNARVELSTERLKSLRCTPAQYLDPNAGCRGGFKTPHLDTYMAVRSQGVIGQRLHIDIDYDSQRDFTAQNNIQLYYLGLEDEVLRRADLGTVSFQLPPSRFLTAAIPANNFGVDATVQVGALTVSGVAATQSGSVVANRTYTVGSTTVQPQDQQARDLDFEGGRFFWVVDPLTLPGFPLIDVLNMNSTGLPPSALIAQGDVRVYRYRPLSPGSAINPNLGGINAIAISTDSSRITAQWQLLQRDLDYYIDPSGLWFALAAKLGPTDYLAVSYRTLSGTRVGTLPSRDAGLVPGRPPSDTLRLIEEPNVAATRATFRYEMRQVYRVAGSDLDLTSLIVNLTLNQSAAPLLPGAQPTYLSQLGLAVTADPNTFDLANRLFPRVQDANASLTIKDHYIVFPTVRPFADSTRLSAAELNDSLYATPDYKLLTQGPPAKFFFRLRYNASSTASRNSLDLGALQIKSGSETLYLNGRRLQNGVDYTINYDLGQVTFLAPDALFGSGVSTIQARFEERGVFAVAPTSLFGISTRYSLGETGGINLVGIYQAEQSSFNRPQLGFEAKANLVGGVTTDLHFKPDAITRLLNHLTSAPSTAPSRLDINAELALTKPDPSRSGQAYLEEFEGDNGIPISLRETLWQFGSEPEFADGVENVIGSAFDTADAVQLTWQNLVPDASGQQPLQLQAQDIDNQIQLAGTQGQLETVLFMALHPDTVGGQPRPVDRHLRWVLPTRLNRPRWRSIVTPLSSTGLDLSNNEYLEFWVFHDAKGSTDSAGVELMFDLGSVNEDAIGMAPESLSTATGDSIYRGRQFVGLGRLDTEREPTGIFNAATDDNGILGDRPDQLLVNGALVQKPALCREVLSSIVQLYTWGDLGERCSNGNGALDTEDLDGDNQLNATGAGENTFRWVVNLADPNSPYFVRNGVQSSDGGVWRLYRIPLRSPDATLGSPNISLIKNLRVTVVGQADRGGPDVTAFFAMARMRFLGAPWPRRSDRPVSSLAGATSGVSGQVIASTVSTEDLNLGYVSPPGVVSGLNPVGGSQSEFGTQINESSLRLVAQSIGLHQRAEAYSRFPSGPQNLLRYSQLQLWFRGRGPGWDDHDFQAYFRVGSDSRNFYQYSATASTSTWLPEVQIDLSVWRTLRAQIEVRRLSGLPADSAARVACGGDTVSIAYVVCDGPYMVYISDPASNPPNLAQVQEMAAGIYRVNTVDPTQDAELWVDDIRLVHPVSNLGTATAMDAHLVASDVGDLALSYSRQDGYFQQIGQSPTYQTTGTLLFSSATRADRFLPASLGIAMPMSATYAASTVDPQLLTGTDIQGSDLPNLRRPRSWSWTYSMSVNRITKGRTWLVRSFVDPLSLSASFSGGRSTTELSDGTSSAHSLQANYLVQQQRRGATLNLAGLVGILPRFLRESEGGKALRRPFLNLVPNNIRLSSGLLRSESDFLAYQVPVYLLSDTTVRPVTALTSTWRNAAGLTWQPLGMLTLSGDLSSTRDLRHYDDSTTLGRLATQSRRSLLGMDVGVETNRQITTSLALTPHLSSWLRPRYLVGSTFLLYRSLNSRQPIRAYGDTLGGFLLPQTLNNSQSTELGAAIDLQKFFARLFGDSTLMGRATRRIRPFDISDRLIRNSTFDLTTFNPGLGYELALGGLDNFLRQGNDSAVGAAETRSTTISSGADLPGGISFSLGYSRLRTDRFQRVPGVFLTTETYQSDWPKGSARFTRTLKNFPISLLGLGVTFRVSHGTTTLPTFGSTPALSSFTSTSWTPDATITFKNGLNITASYSLAGQTNLTNGNVTQSDQDDFSGVVSHSFLLPQSFGRVRRLVRSQLSINLDKSTSCLQTTGQNMCSSISDTRRQEYRANLDTDLAKILTGGLQVTYSITEAAQLASKFSDIIISATFQLSLFAGDYR